MRLQFDYDRGDVHPELFKAIEEEVGTYIKNINLERTVKRVAKDILEQYIELLIVSALGIDTTWHDPRVKPGSPLEKIIMEKVHPLAITLVNETVGDKLEPEEGWLEAIVEEAREAADSEVRGYITGKIFSSHGLDSDVRSVVQDAVEAAAKDVAKKAIADALVGK